jgi:hypothetical protein
MSTFQLKKRPLLERAKMFGLGDEVEALMALVPIVSKIAYERAPLNDTRYREARDALAALRAAGIMEEKT